MSALQTFKTALGLRAPTPESLDAVTQHLATLTEQHGNLVRHRSQLLEGTESLSKAPPGVVEADAKLDALNAKIDTVRKQHAELQRGAHECSESAAIHDAVERGRQEAKAKPPSDAQVQATRKALAAAQAANTKAQDESKAAAASKTTASGEADERKRTYEASPSDDAWTAYEKARSKAERSSIDAAVAEQRAASTAQALAEAERAAAVAEYEYELAICTQPIDDALAAEAIAIVGRAVTWFVQVRERQRSAFAERTALHSRARALGVSVPTLSPELTAGAYGLAQVASELWAAAAHASGKSPAKSTTASADSSVFEASFFLDAPPGVGPGGGSHRPETVRARFTLDTIRRSARALAR